MGRPLIGLDTVIFIYTWNKNPDFLSQAKDILNQVQTGRVEGLFSEIGIIELLTGVKKLGRYDMVIQYKEQLVNFPNLKIAGLNSVSIDIASSLRAKYGLTTPDAIHLATAIDAKASVFYTNDRKLKIVKEIKVETL